MTTVILQLAKRVDSAKVLEIDPLKRKEVINKAIARNECYLIIANESPVGFVIFNYNFFGRGFIDLIEIKEGLQGKGLGGAAIKKLFGLCKTNKIFTSTNESNEPMKKLLTKLGFVFAGKIDGLDEGDPEMFYYKILTRTHEQAANTLIRFNKISGVNLCADQTEK